MVHNTNDINEIRDIIYSEKQFYINYDGDDKTAGITIDCHFDEKRIRIRPHIVSDEELFSPTELPRLSNVHYWIISLLFEKFSNTFTYIIDQSDECYLLDYVIFDIMNLQSRFNILTKRIHFMGPDFYGKREIHNISKNLNSPLYKYIPHWNLANHAGLHSLDTASKLFNKSNVVKKYKTTLLLSKPRTSRFELVMKLFDIGYYNNTALFSTFSNRKSTDYNLDALEDYTHFIKTNNYSIKYLKDNFLEQTRFGKFLGKSIPVDAIQTRHVPFDNDSYLWITSETFVDVNNIMFITEKILKSYLWYKPMIVFAVPNTLGILKELGFIDVFELMGFDSSYDTIMDVDERLECIVKQIELFINTSYQKLHELYNLSSVQSALIHNNTLFRKLIGTDILGTGIDTSSRKIINFTVEYQMKLEKNETDDLDSVDFYSRILNKNS